MKNIDKIRQMTVDELATMLSAIEECSYCPATRLCDECYNENCYTIIKKWLEKESEE